MKILVLGAMHGNELLGPEVIKYFKKQPNKNVDVMLANKPALRRNVRFIKQDLNRSFPGNSESDIFEEKRAAELMNICRKYDLVLDFHNTYCPNNDCSFIGTSSLPNLSDISSWLGLKRVIVADYDCLNKYAPNCLSVEISLNSPENEAKIWCDKITKLASLNSFPKSSGNKFYKFVYRITLEDKKKLGLVNKNLKAFEPIDIDLATKFGLKSPAYPIFINDAFTPYNYGGLLNDLD